MTVVPPGRSSTVAAVIVPSPQPTSALDERRSELLVDGWHDEDVDVGEHCGDPVVGDEAGDLGPVGQAERVDLVFEASAIGPVTHEEDLGVRVAQVGRGLHEPDHALLSGQAADDRFVPQRRLEDRGQAKNAHKIPPSRQHPAG